MIKIQNSKYSFLLALILGVVSAVALSVWATSIGTNIDVSGTIAVAGTTGTSTFASGQGLNFGSGQLVIQQTSGNVIIGTTNPTGGSRLHVGHETSVAQISIDSLTNDSFSILSFREGATLHTDFLQFNSNFGVEPEPSNSFQIRARTASGDIRLFNIDDSSTGRRGLVISPTNKVGIGTTSPYARLSVHAFAGETNTTFFAIASSTASATTTHLVVTNTGNLGIGTTSPYALLSVEANTTATDLFAVGDTGTSSPLFVVKGSGSVGIGTTTTAKLSVQGRSQFFGNGDYSLAWGNLDEFGRLTYEDSSKSSIIEALSPGDIIFQARAERMRITSAGNVGVGTTSPAINAVLSVATSTATSTLYISSQHGTRGGCIQLEGPASTTFRAYATTTGPLILESGACQ